MSCCDGCWSFFAAIVPCIHSPATLPPCRGWDSKTESSSNGMIPCQLTPIGVMVCALDPSFRSREYVVACKQHSTTTTRAADAVAEQAALLLPIARIFRCRSHHSSLPQNRSPLSRAHASSRYRYLSALQKRPEHACPHSRHSYFCPRFRDRFESPSICEAVDARDDAIFTHPHRLLARGSFYRKAQQA